MTYYQPRRSSLARKSALWAAALVLLPVAADAGLLLNNPAAYVDGSNVTWTGTTAFSVNNLDNSPDLQGTVDWSVFAPGHFPYAANGYTPTTGEYTYAYQVFESGPAPVSSFSVALLAAADNIGNFTLATAVPTDPVLGEAISPLSNAKWTMKVLGTADDPPTGDASYGLAFSSPIPPQDLFGSLVDDGNAAFVIPLPSPNANFSFPEPASLSLVMAAGGASLLRRRRQ